MPHRRRAEKGSFGGQLDDLVKNFPHGPAADDAAKTGRGQDDDRHINDKLFEAAWRKTGAEQASERPGKPSLTRP